MAGSLAIAIYRGLNPDLEGGPISIIAWDAFTKEGSYTPDEYEKVKKLLLRGKSWCQCIPGAPRTIYAVLEGSPPAQFLQRKLNEQLERSQENYLQ